MNAQKTPQSQVNMEIVGEAWINCINKKQSQKFLKLHSENVVMYDPTLPDPVRGPQGLGNWFTGIFKMFPDYHIEKERIFAQDESVCLESVESGTFKGAIIGPDGQTVPPTNKSFRIRSCTVCKVQERQIKEVRIYYDVLNLITQVGLPP